jgi:hypothetical protein
MSRKSTKPAADLAKAQAAFNDGLKVYISNESASVAASVVLEFGLNEETANVLQVALDRMAAAWFAKHRAGKSGQKVVTITAKEVIARAMAKNKVAPEIASDVLSAS